MKESFKDGNSEAIVSSHLSTSSGAVDSELMSSVLTWLGHLDARFVMLYEGLKNGNLSAAREASHKLSAAGLYGYLEFGKLAAAVDLALREADFEKAKAILPGLEDMYERISRGAEIVRRRFESAKC